MNIPVNIFISLIFGLFFCINRWKRLLCLHPQLLGLQEWAAMPRSVKIYFSVKYVYVCFWIEPCLSEHRWSWRHCYIQISKHVYKGPPAYVSKCAIRVFSNTGYRACAFPQYTNGMLFCFFACFMSYLYNKIMFMWDIVVTLTTCVCLMVCLQQFHKVILPKYY